MANTCSFQGIIIGTMREIKAFMYANNESYDYQLKDPVQDELRELRDAHTKPYPRHIENKIKRLLQNKENYLNYPKHPHFFRVFDFYTDFPFDSDSDKSSLKQFKHGKNEDGRQLYRAEFDGNCAWSCESAFLEENTHYIRPIPGYQVMTNYINLYELHEKYPNLQLEITSTEPCYCFTERIFKDSDGISMECADYEEYYDEESNGMKYGIAEDCHWLYTKHYPNDDHSDEEVLEHNFTL